MSANDNAILIGESGERAVMPASQIAKLGIGRPWVECARCRRVMHGPSPHRCGSNFRKRHLLWRLAEAPPPKQDMSRTMPVVITDAGF